MRLSPGPDPGRGARRSHVRAIFGLDFVSEHLTGSRRKRTQAGGRAGPVPRLISAADSQMLICHFRSRVKEIKGREGKKWRQSLSRGSPFPYSSLCSRDILEMDWNGLGLDWAYPAPARRRRASLQDPALGIPRSQAARQGWAGTGSADQGQRRRRRRRRQHRGAAQPPASPAAALLLSGFKGHRLTCKGKKKKHPVLIRPRLRGAVRPHEFLWKQN